MKMCHFVKRFEDGECVKMAKDPTLIWNEVPEWLDRHVTYPWKAEKSMGHWSTLCIYQNSVLRMPHHQNKRVIIKYLSDHTIR